MWQYNYYPVSYELYHHGILGMHWGKRNGPPYPLDTSDHSASEKKAGWRKSLSNDGKVAAVKQAKKEDRNNRSIEKQVLTDAEQLSKTHAAIEDMTRALTKDTKKGQQILVTTDTKKQYSELLSDYTKQMDVMSKKYDQIDSEHVVVNGKHYLHTTLLSKDGIGAEYLTELKESYSNSGYRDDSKWVNNHSYN